MACEACSLKAAFIKAKSDHPDWAHRLMRCDGDELLIIDTRDHGWLASLQTRKERVNDSYELISWLEPIFGPVPRKGVTPTGRDHVNRAQSAHVCKLMNRNQNEEITDGC